MLQSLCKDFRFTIVPRSMVSLRFIGHQSITDSTLFTHCILNCKKVERISLEEMHINLDFANKLSDLF